MYNKTDAILERSTRVGTSQSLYIYIISIPNIYLLILTAGISSDSLLDTRAKCSSVEQSFKFYILNKNSAVALVVLELLFYL